MTKLRIMISPHVVTHHVADNLSEKLLIWHVRASSSSHALAHICPLPTISHTPIFQCHTSRSRWRQPYLPEPPTLHIRLNSSPKEKIHIAVDAFELNASSAAGTESPVRFSRNFSLSAMMLPSLRDHETSHQQLNQSSPPSSTTSSTQPGSVTATAATPQMKSTDEAHNNVALIKIGEASALPVMLCGILQNKEQFYQQALQHQQQQQYFADLQNSPDYYSA